MKLWGGAIERFSENGASYLVFLPSLFEPKGGTSTDQAWPGGTNGDGWDSSQQSFASYSNPILARGQIVPTE